MNERSVLNPDWQVVPSRILSKRLPAVILSVFADTVQQVARPLSAINRRQAREKILNPRSHVFGSELGQSLRIVRMVSMECRQSKVDNSNVS